jgi:hypothetical protein
LAQKKGLLLKKALNRIGLRMVRVQIVFIAVFFIRFQGWAGYRVAGKTGKGWQGLMPPEISKISEQASKEKPLPLWKGLHLLKCLRRVAFRWTVNVGFPRDWMVFGLDRIFFGFSKGYVGFWFSIGSGFLLVVSGIGSFVNTKLNTLEEEGSASRRMCMRKR